MWLALIAAGLAAGTVSGLMGVGGGIIMTPVLHYLAGFAWPDAVALSLFVITIQAPIGIWRHRRRAAVDLHMAVPLIAGGAAGVGAGIWLEPRIAVPILKAAFAVLMVFAAHRLTHPRAAPADGHRPGVAMLLVLGVGAGIVSRLLGVGGGILTVPVLALVGVPAHLAVGTSLVPVWTNAAVASGINLLAGLAWWQGIGLAAGAVIGAPLGVRLAHALDEQRLRAVVALALALVAVLVVWDAATT